MEKMVSFPEKRVRDLGGLYLCLKKAGYAVRNVGVDEFGTYVYLEDIEDKDPTTMIEEWAKKPAPAASDRKALKARTAATKQVEEAEAAVKAAEEAAKIAAAAAEKAVADAAAQAEAAAAAAQNGTVIEMPPAEVQPSVEELPKKESLWKRIKNVIW